MKLWKKVGIGASVLFVAAAGYVVASIGPRNILGMLRYDKRREGTFQVGDRAPDVVLAELEGDREQSLLARLAGRPLVLVFGSFT